ncbi:MAG: sigma 54-interacting transcriptional regulator [Draconibacterium sp.]
MENNEKETIRFLQLAIENLSTAVFAINEEYRLLIYNKTFSDYINVITFINSVKTVFDIFPQEVPGKIMKLLKTTFEFGYSEAEVELYTTPDKKKKFYVALNRFFLNGEQYAVGEIHDISLRLKSEEELKKALTNLQKLTLELEVENNYLKEEISQVNEFKEFISQNSTIEQILKNLKQVGITDAPVYILGENGTGKELVARTVHQLSRRRYKPFVQVNCESISLAQVEEEIFGINKKVSPEAGKPNKLELARGGTLFLKRINKLSPALQNKLLEALEQTSSAPQPYDVRIIISSTVPLSSLVETNMFSEELYYKLCIFPVELPALRERKEDIELLVNFFTTQYNKKYNFKLNKIPKNILNELQNYDWPGNVSELRSLVERAVISSKGNFKDFRDMLHIKRKIAKLGRQFQPWDEHEKTYLVKVLEYTQWKIRGKEGAAHLLQLKPTTLESKMKRLGIRKQND